MTRIGGLFEGYGGLTMAARAVLGGDLAWVSEFEPATKANPRPTQAPARLLAHRHPDVPNLGDISAVDWPRVEPVDVLCGGFPCQDVSSAGKRVGMKPDSRSGLWAHFARAIAVLRPSVVLIENVRGLLSAEAACDLEPCPWCLGDERERPLRALGAVLGDLAALGYDAQWTCVGADAVGAPHRRARVFILAWPVADAAHLGHERSGGARIGRARPADGGVHAAADSSSVGRREGRPEPTRLERGPHAAQCGVDVAADPDRSSYAEVATRAEQLDGQRPPLGRGSVEFAGPRRDSGADVGRTTGESAGRRALAPEDPGDRRGAIAHAERNGWAGRDSRRAGATDEQRQGSRPEAPGRSPNSVADPNRARPQGQGLDGSDRPAAVGDGAQVGPWGDYAGAVGRWERVLGRSAPAPTQTGKRGGQQLSPRFVEWMMGLPEGWVTDVPGLTRNEQLKLLGNGVVPQQAEHALRLLLAQLAAEAVAA